MRSVVAVFLTLFSGSQAGAEDLRLPVVVQLIDYAQVHPGDWRAAVRETDHIFRKVAIEVHWRPSVQAPEFDVILLSPAMVARKTRDDRLGDAVVARCSKAAGRAYIFVSRVLARANARGLNRGAFLARVIAHELGHMIGDLKHSTTGVMREELQWNEAGHFLFSPDEGKALRQSVEGAIATGAPQRALRTGPLREID